jgi:hypothetical protein
MPTLGRPNRMANSPKVSVAGNQHAPILMRRGQHLFVAHGSDDIACSYDVEAI